MIMAKVMLISQFFVVFRRFCHLVGSLVGWLGARRNWSAEFAEKLRRPKKKRFEFNFRRSAAVSPKISPKIKILFYFRPQKDPRLHMACVSLGIIPSTVSAVTLVGSSEGLYDVYLL
jgi:hypothetical protein